ncbi:MAG: AMP-binding protein [Rhodobiaceae bacterium]|nr:AMP-binding protein [Rhodobiaceae bacterium]MCC0056293.1 AMP-binding protein [Rhodobiaceae bacterium]
MASKFDPAAHAVAMRAGGYWIDTSFDQYLMQTLATNPDGIAIVADRDGKRTRITWRELEDMVARAAAALKRMGIGPGDIVAMQLPNWWQFAVCFLASQRVGAVANPLIPIFREHELTYMLGFAGAKVFISPKTFRGFDHESMARGLKEQLPTIEQLIIVDGDGADSMDNALLGGSERLAAAPSGFHTGILPDNFALMTYTSGTTGSPKGVMHSTNTAVTGVNAFISRFGLRPDDIILACSPLGHLTGLIAGLLIGIRNGSTVVLQDIWDRNYGVRLMAEEGVTFMAGSTPFLADICEAVAAGGPKPGLRLFLCAGAPIPSALVERAAKELGLTVCSVWGMTESIASTITEPERAAEKSSRTDGRAVDGMEVKVVDDEGRTMPFGKTGNLLVRGSQMLLGYYRRDDIELFDDDGWFQTGDLAYMDEEGYIRIDGRTKDMIIRGGENVPVSDIENLLYKHPAIVDCALVGIPDARLGERGCVFVTLRHGQTLELPEIQRYLAECKVAKQYWPERLEVVEGDLPRTPTGKIQKFALREQAKAFAA